MTERERFEQWISTRKLCKKYGAKLDLLPDGLHRDVRVRGHFSTWQAARASLSLKIPQSCACSREITTGWTADNGIPLCNVCGRVDVSAAFEMAKEPPKVPQGVDEAAIEKALRRAFNLGQTYWQQADSESYSQNRKSDETLQKFNTLVVETSSKFSGMALVPVDALNSIMELAGVALVYQPFGTKDRQHFDALLAATKDQQCQS